MNRSSAAYFISDAHLGLPVAEHPDREARLLRFLDSIRGTATHLFLLGDVFDFWFEYKKLVRADYFPVLHAIAGLAESGTAVHVHAGNHDFALGDFFPRAIHAVVHMDPIDIEIQGKRVHLQHGDGVLAADVGYRLLRSLLRFPPFQWLYKLIHPVAGIFIADRVSRLSRHLTGGSILEEPIIRAYRRAAQRILNRGTDIAVFGHTHTPELCRENDKTYCNTGDWMRRFTFAKLENGMMSLWEYGADGVCNELSANKF
jgi:UDP-2,3-diacylglucosamine hydrolase